MTADLLRHLATIIDRREDGLDDDAPAREICALLGLDLEAPWPDIATALRLHATTLTPGLPKGWGAYNKHVSDSLTTHSVYGPTNHSYVMLHVRDDGTVRWDTDGQRYAPPAVYAYLLARAGMVS